MSVVHQGALSELWYDELVYLVQLLAASQFIAVVDVSVGHMSVTVVVHQYSLPAILHLVEQWLL